jgi:hypothetical protein
MLHFTYTNAFDNHLRKKIQGDPRPGKSVTVREIKTIQGKVLKYVKKKNSGKFSELSES